MLQGEHYDSRDPELIGMYHQARQLFQEYNRLDSTEMDGREEIFGEQTFINANCFFLDNNTITIGKNGLIGPYVQIYTAGHPLKASERIVKNMAGETSYVTNTKPVTIGDNVWIGGNTVIMPGIAIGHNVTIGAASVVTKDIPDNVLAYGNPCKVIKAL